MKRMFFLLSAMLFVSAWAIELPDNLPSRGPVLTTSAVIEIYDQNFGFQGIVLIERGKDPCSYALPGGGVEYGESVEDAVRREMKEEINLELSDLSQFHVYSDPGRDPRFHSVEIAFLARAIALPQAGDDAATPRVVPLEAIPWNKLVFDHASILQDYLRTRPSFGSLGPIGKRDFKLRP